MDGNFNMGKWRDLEKVFDAALKQDKTVDVKMDVIYKSDGGRPDKFAVTYKIGDIEQQRFFNNKPGG